MAYSGAFGTRASQPPPESDAPPAPRREDGAPRRQPDKLSGAVGALMKRLETLSSGMETDDLVMALILYLMYRESGDKDLLIMLGAILLT